MHITLSDLEARIDHIIESPADDGSLSMIVRRPVEDEREVLETGELTLADGLAGDLWRAVALENSRNDIPDPATQLTLMNARAIDLIASGPERWAQAGDQLYVDFDLSEDNLPPGSLLTIDEAMIEVSSVPHRGCQKFSRRFGVDALRFVNSEGGRKLRLRGLYARVVVPGTIRQGDPVRKHA